MNEEKKDRQDRRKYAKAVRALARFIETHPEIPLPSWRSISTSMSREIERDPEAVAAIVRAMKPVTKEMSNDLLILSRDFGAGVTLRVCASRELICTKRVVGREFIERAVEQTEDGRFGYWREKVEWDCGPGSLLAEVEEAR